MFVVCILSRVNTPAKFDFWQQFSQQFRLTPGKHDVMKV